MSYEYDPQVVRSVLHHPQIGAGSIPYGTSLDQDRFNLRTPLHAKNIHAEKLVTEATRISLEASEDLGNPEVFNAVGSRDTRDFDRHFPVIEVNGIITTQRNGNKIILHAMRPEKNHSYKPQSELVDVLGDYGISCEVWEDPVVEGGERGFPARYEGKAVTDIVLRAKRKTTHHLDVFEAYSSDKISQLYIQRSFRALDYIALVSELGHLGMISPEWQELSEAAGMGIVLAPWHDTEKQIV